jgi:pimeloyl-ACP methyl ester carboxylesterase
MSRVYNRLVDTICRLGYWALDYTYAGYWQLYGLLQRHKIDDRPASQPTDAEPVILIPGVYENWSFMIPVANILSANGYNVHVVRELGYNTGTVEDMARIVRAYIHSQKIGSYTVVAHSKGGLIAKYLLMMPASNVRQAITINTPFGGSRYAKLFLQKNIRNFSSTSSIMKTLATNTAANTHVVSIYGRFDPHIPEGSYLDGATNIQLDTYGHFRVLNDPRVHDAILTALLARK